jgi:hypothetical protein
VSLFARNWNKVNELNSITRIKEGENTVGVFFPDGYFESTFNDAELELSGDVLQIILRIRKQGEMMKQELFKKIEFDFDILSRTL